MDIILDPTAWKQDPMLPVERRSDIYPAIDPQPAWTSQSFAGKTVLIVGASRGIGQTIALYYAKAGAAVAITARSSLEDTRALIEKEAPGAKVLTFEADVKDKARAAEVVEKVVKECGGLDVLIYNSAASLAWEKRLGDVDIDGWWNTFEVNIRGALCYVQPAIPHLEKARGYSILVASAMSTVRAPLTSDYSISKHTLVRLAEYIQIEHPALHSFSIHPCQVSTELTKSTLIGDILLTDKPDLAAGTALALCSGRYDWLAGRYVDSNWDLNEVEEKYKAQILEKDLLVSKLALPS
ncbi:NAD-P-binding protein [Peniophora sp. CONT]|nr:NAD-P-binding protein [Peniophora sp. CONT]